MAEVAIKELEVEIEGISSDLNTLNNKLKIDYDEYIRKKDSLLENRQIYQSSQDVISSFTESEQIFNSQTQKYIGDLYHSLNTICDKLEKNADYYLFSQKILNLHQILQAAKSNIELDTYEAALSIVKAKKQFDDCSKSCETYKFLSIYGKLEEEYSKVLNCLFLSTKEKWDTLIKFECSNMDRRTKSTCVTVSLSMDSLQSVYQTLLLLNMSNPENSFCDQLMKDILKPLLTYSCKVLLNKTECSSSLKIEYVVKYSKINLKEVVDNSVKAFDFINTYLNMNSEKSNFIKNVGTSVSNIFLSQFFEEHLSKNIPLKRSEISDYEHALIVTKPLISVMKLKEFIQEDNILVNEFCNDPLKVFEQKIGLRYKDIAVSLMKQDLQNIIKIEPMTINYSMPEFKQVLLSTEEAERDYWDMMLNLLNNDSRRRCFSECQISKSMDDIIGLIHTCMEEATCNNPNINITLHNTAHEIVYEYLKSPEIHRKLLDVIPQQSALVFTNTLYLIMKLIEFDKEFKTDDLFGELIGQLQNMAFRELNKQIRSQEEVMLSSLQSSGLQELSELEVFPKNTEKTVRQCLRQLMLMQNVWMNVLPQDVYCIVMGRLVDRFINEIIDLIVSATDIREDIANDLVQLFNVISDKVPQVFPDSREVNKFVRSWLKLRELGSVLAGSLAEITERWAGGSGPLAHEMSPSQVKSLILALFQSSEIRQKTLGSIK